MSEIQTKLSGILLGVLVAHACSPSIQDETGGLPQVLPRSGWVRIKLCLKNKQRQPNQQYEKQFFSGQCIMRSYIS